MSPRGFMNKELPGDENKWQEFSETQRLGQEPQPGVETPPTTKEQQEQLGPKEQAGIAIKKEGGVKETIEGLTRRLRQPKKKKITKIPQMKDDVTRRVEKIMEEGLADAYQELTPIQQQEFKIKGEETAIQIRSLLRSSKLKVKKIFRLLLEWLKVLPGINRFFLEQEAKIKADKIVALKHFDQKQK